MSLLVVAPLKPGCMDRARELLDQGPPFSLDDMPFESHEVFLTVNEVVFVFEGGEGADTLTFAVGDPLISRVAQAWADCLDGRPRVARPVFTWKRSQPSG
jgi:hypothetical protein